MARRKISPPLNIDTDLAEDSNLNQEHLDITPESEEESTETPVFNPIDDTVAEPEEESAMGLMDEVIVEDSQPEPPVKVIKEPVKHSTSNGQDKKPKQEARKIEERRLKNKLRFVR